MNKIDYILMMVLMVILSGCDSLFDKEIPEYQVSDATAVTDQASSLRISSIIDSSSCYLIWGTMVCFLFII